MMESCLVDEQLPHSNFSLPKVPLMASNSTNMHTHSTITFRKVTPCFARFYKMQLWEYIRAGLFLLIRCPSRHLPQSVKSLNVTQRTKSNQARSLDRLQKTPRTRCCQGTAWNVTSIRPTRCYQHDATTSVQGTSRIATSCPGSTSKLVTLHAASTDRKCHFHVPVYQNVKWDSFH